MRSYRVVPSTPPPERENTSSRIREGTRRKSKCLLRFILWRWLVLSVPLPLTMWRPSLPPVCWKRPSRRQRGHLSWLHSMTGQSGTAEPYLHLIPHAPSHHRPSLCGAGAERARGAQAQENVNSRFGEEVAEPSSSHRSPISSGVFIAGLW